MRRLVLLALGVLLAACAQGERPAGPAIVPLAQRLGRAPVVVASLLIRTEPEQGEGEQFSLRLWATADGAVRLRAKQLDVDFLEALVRADGSYEALLVRERVATAGTLGGPADPPLLRDLSLLMGELRDGPVPPGVSSAGSAVLQTWRDPGGWDAALDLGLDGLPLAKRLGADGVVVRSLAYGPWQAYDGLIRSSLVRLRVADIAGLTSIRIKTLDTPPTISAERMVLRLPDGVERVDPATFTLRMP
jgi:hypothetical protein